MKALIQQLISSGYRPDTNISFYISEKLKFNYAYLSYVFSGSYGITIERYYIHCKIDKAKILLVDTVIPICDIARQLHYCSKGHFSTQFKLVAGISPSAYRRKKTGLQI
ncbi:MAG: AraC family transcriptional regulator [Chitinophagaceae bacterium]|nr:MAG: AraC family transcriptional regulator [Chitinophagaceae bacterium]